MKRIVNALASQGIDNIMVAIDSDRFGGSVQKLCSSYRGHRLAVEPLVLPVNEKLEDWLCILLDRNQTSCRCCGARCLETSVVKRKYKKYMTARLIPSRLSRIGCGDLHRLFRGEPCAALMASLMECGGCRQGFPPSGCC